MGRDINLFRYSTYLFEIASYSSFCVQSESWALTDLSGAHRIKEDESRPLLNKPAVYRSLRYCSVLFSLFVSEDSGVNSSRSGTET